MVDAPEIEQGGDDEDVEMVHTPVIEHGEGDYGGCGTAMASGSETAPEYPAYYHDLCLLERYARVR